MNLHNLKLRNVTNKNVIKALHRVPREEFVPSQYKQEAYADNPLPIGEGQTISQPYIVAFMTEAAQLKPSDRVLEIGTGCGYQTAVLSELGCEIYSIEVLETLSLRAQKTLDELGYKSINLKVGDGYNGWPEEAPFDAIIVTAAPAEVPSTLLEQLKLGGRLVIPVGDKEQELLRITRTKEGFQEERLLAVRFVPMIKEKII